jgi:hypothetical protein
MNTTAIKPSNHNIDATEIEIAYLNDLAIANARYRNAVKSLKEACVREEDGTFWGIGNQTLMDVKKFEGNLEQLLNMKWILFAGSKAETAAEQTAYSDKVQGWIKTAMELNPTGMYGANQFFPIRK